MTVTIIVLLVLGGALTLFSTWERMGLDKNARSWVDSPSETAPHMALFVRPGLGLVLLSLGLIRPLGDIAVVGPLVALLGPIGLILLFWGILRLPYPRWWVPGFARARHDRDREQRRSARARKS